MEPYYEHAHRMMDDINGLPQVRAWRKEQVAKIAELQQGTWRESKDQHGNPVAKPPFGGPECWFEYVVADVGIATPIKIRCVVTNEEIELEDGPA